VTPDSPAFKACRVVEITPEMVSGKSDLIQGKPEEVRRALAESLLNRGLPGDIQAVKDMGFELRGGPDQGWSLKG
jgi:hypothetical protein